MIDFLSLLLAQHTPEIRQGHSPQLSWQWLGEGILVLTPRKRFEKSVVLSAGIHGNETAPIELLAQLCQDLLNGRLPLAVKLLCILGNPAAIRSGQRYIENDMNRMFCGGYRQLPRADETLRAEQLEQVVADFFARCPAETSYYHFDLHTAIRSSLLPTFALFPYQSHAYDQRLLQCLESADLDAIVYHNADARTFTHFSSANFQAASVTLELGQAKPFGCNDLKQFAAIDLVLRAVVSEQVLPARKKPRMRQFKVVDSIIKSAEDFQLNLAEDAANFSSFEQGQVIATQSLPAVGTLDTRDISVDQIEVPLTHQLDLSVADTPSETEPVTEFSSEISLSQRPENHDYVVRQAQVFILFPNAKVKLGLRAGLVLEEI